MAVVTILGGIRGAGPVAEMEFDIPDGPDHTESLIVTIFRARSIKPRTEKKFLDVHSPMTDDNLEF